MSTHNIYFSEYRQICGLDMDSTILNNKNNFKYALELISFWSKGIAQDMNMYEKCEVPFMRSAYKYDTAHAL